MILIHTALLCEAQSIIEKYKLKKTNSNPKIYKNDNIIAAVGGIGEFNTVNCLKYVFDNFKISKAFNIGTAGCSDQKIDVGELFCTNKDIPYIASIKLKTVDSPQTLKIEESCLYDMEGEFFFKICLNHLDEQDIFIFKVVSDHLDDSILPKDFIKSLIGKRLKDIPI